MIKIKYSPSIAVIGTLPIDMFLINVLQSPEFSAGSVGTLVLRDVTYNTNTSAGTKNNFIISIAKNVNLRSFLTNLTPSICSLDAFGNVKWLSNGEAIIKCKVNTQGQKNYKQVLSSSIVTVKSSVNSIQAGSLRKYLYDQMEALLAGNTTLAGQRYYTDETQTAKVTPSFTDKAISGFDAYSITQIDQRIWLTDNVFIHPNGTSHNYVPTGTPDFDYVEFYVSTLVFAPGGRGSEPRSIMPPFDFSSYIGEADPLCPIPLLARLTHTYNAVPETEHWWISPVDYVARNTINAPGSENSSPGPRVAVFPVSSLRPSFSRNTTYTRSGSNVYNGICIGGDSFSPVFTGIKGTLIPMGIVALEGGWIDYFPALMVEYQAACDLLHTNNGIATQAITTINLSTWFSVV